MRVIGKTIRQLEAVAEAVQDAFYGGEDVFVVNVDTRTMGTLVRLVTGSLRSPDVATTFRGSRIVGWEYPNGETQMMARDLRGGRTVIEFYSPAYSVLDYGPDWEGWIDYGGEG